MDEIRKIAKQIVSVKRKELETHKIEIKLVDFTKDKDEPAYDVEVWIDGKPTMGGGSKQLYGVYPGKGTKYKHQSDTKEEALGKAKDRIKDILSEIKKIGEE